MKRIQLFSAVLAMLAALMGTSGCGPSNSEKEQQARADSTRVADSLKMVAQVADSLLHDSIAQAGAMAHDSASVDPAAGDSAAGDPKAKDPKKDPGGSTGRLDKCYFKVSFISIGSGTDTEAGKKLKTEIASFEKSEKVKLDMERKNWGREGEHDFCFSSLGLTDAQREKWAKRIRKVFKGNELVQIPD